MSLPVCPKCKSSTIRSGYPLSAGACQCSKCNFIGPTAEFHLSPQHFNGLRVMARDLATLPLTVYRRGKKSETIQPKPKHYWWQDQ